MLERLLKNDRRLVLGCLIFVCLAAWGWMIAGAGMEMDGLEMTRHSMMNMDTMPHQNWSVSYALLMFSMWWVMMIAMMIPSAAPIILLAAAINRRAQPEKKPYGSTLAFTSGYLIAWGVFSIIAAGIQWWLGEINLINSMLKSKNQWLSAALLIISGAWQFTPWKTACLKHCRNPVDFLTCNRHPGNTGALKMGIHHGLYCLGCCWFLMVLLFVGGVMNLYWIAGLAIYVWIEKITIRGILIGKLMGLTLILWGLVILAMAQGWV